MLSTGGQIMLRQGRDPLCLWTNSNQLLDKERGQEDVRWWIGGLQSNIWQR